MNNTNLNENNSSNRILKITKYIFIFGLILAGVTFIVWFNRIYQNNDRRFWQAIDNSMSTNSTVRTLSDGGSGNQFVQDFRFHYSPVRVVENKVVYTQKSATSESSVVTKGIVFYPQEQYLKYDSFESVSDGKATKIDQYLDKWASDTSTGEQAEQTYEGEMITLAIFGNYDSNFRNMVLSQMKSENVYGNNISSATEKTVNGDKILDYNVTVNLKKYITLLNTALKRANFNDFPPLDPGNFQDDATLNAQISVRKRDSTIVGISYSGRDESYGNYGVTKTIIRPKAELSLSELQDNVTKLLQ